MDVSHGGGSSDSSWGHGVLGFVGQPARSKVAEGRRASLAAGEAGPRTAGGGESKEGKSLAGSGQPQNLDVVHRVFWGLDHDVRSYVVAPQRDPIAVGPQLLLDGAGVGPYLRGERDCCVF